MIKKKTLFRILNITAWALMSAGILVLLVSAVRKEQEGVCQEVVVEFNGEQSYRMLDEKEVLSALFPEATGGLPRGRKMRQFNLFALEKQLEKNPWVKNADLFFDQQHVLHISLSQRTPVARLFTPAGNSFYMDASYAVLPLKSNDLIDLPVFTQFYVDPAGAKAADTLLMERVSGLSRFLLSDPFWMAQVEEININADNSFELYTQVGDHTVQLGLRNDWPQLFYKLKTLYKGLQQENAWGKYTTIDLQFKDQAVCVRKGDLFKVVDSAMVTTDTITIQHNTTTITPVKNNL